uniref:NADH dehydrogenase subunit 6 n=1 Tax=Xanthostigma gobicola TaxID=1593331 RepID=A0A1S5QYY0_9NEOP|nr:NADH dehydrogenase subunit 6 [Xanthostigma gobicola]
MFFIFILISILLLFNMSKIKHPLSMGFFLNYSSIFSLYNKWYFLEIFSDFLTFFFNHNWSGINHFHLYNKISFKWILYFFFKNFIFNIIIMSTLIFILSFYFDYFDSMNYYFNNNMNLLYQNNEINLNLNKLYNMHSKFFTLMSMLFLFITLITLLKITNIFMGPFRQNLK